MNRILCAIMIVLTASGCNTNSSSTNSTGQEDTSAKRLVVSSNDSNSVRANDSLIHANLNLVKIDNMDCPVCHKSLSKGIEDTGTYACILYGFDSKQCKEDFVKNPSSFSVIHK